MIFTLLALLAAPMAGGSDHVVTVRYEQGMRIPNHRVVVTVDAAPQLILQTESKDGTRKETTLRLSPASFAELQKELKQTDWNKARRDKVRGLDGATVRILYQGKEVSLWSPDYDTGKRGLETTQSLVRKVFGLAGLDPVGMPAKPPGSKTAR